jgi:hypothetical protein
MTTGIPSPTVRFLAANCQRHCAYQQLTNQASWRPSGVLNGRPPPPIRACRTFPQSREHEDSHRSVARRCIELRNLTGNPANIGGWFLTDAFDTPRKYRIPIGTTIPANGYIVFYQSNSFGVGAGNFALSSKGDDVYLFSADPATTNLTGLVHGFDFGPQANGITFGRHVVSTGEDHFPTQTSPTLGAANSGPVGPLSSPKSTIVRWT